MFGARWQTAYSLFLPIPRRVPLVFGLMLLATGAFAAPAAAPTPSRTVTTAVTLSYTNPDNTIQTSQSNAASFVVAPKAGVAASPASATQSLGAGESACAFPLLIQNTGAGADTFDVQMTLPTGGSAALVQDTDSNGPYAAGQGAPLALPVNLGAGQSVRCVLLVTFPAPVTMPERVGVTVTSRADPAQQAGVVDTMQAPAPDLAALSPVWAVPTGGPVLCEATVFRGVAYVGSDDGFVYAIAATPEGGRQPGTTLWQAQTGARVRCAPAVFAAPGGRVELCVGNEAGRLFALDAATGQTLWSAGTGAGGAQPWRSRPLVSTDGSLVTVPGAGGCLWTYNTASGRLRRRAPWRDTGLAGNPTGTSAAGPSWQMGASGWGMEMMGGLAGRRVWLGGAAGGALAFDPVQNSLVGVTRAGYVLSYDNATLQPNARWAAWTTLPGAGAQASAEGDMETPVTADTAASALPAAPGGVALSETVEASPVLDSVNGRFYVATDSHRVYAVSSAAGTPAGGGWPFAPVGAAGAAFRATPLVWPSRAGTAPTLYVGDTAGGLYAVPTDGPAQAALFLPPAGPLPPLGEWDAAPAASGTGTQDVLVVGNTNGVIYGLALR